MMIDRWLYTATALALASVFALEGTFATSLLRAFGEPTATLSLNPWAEGSRRHLSDVARRCPLQGVAAMKTAWHAFAAAGAVRVI